MKELEKYQNQCGELAKEIESKNAHIADLIADHRETVKAKEAIISDQSVQIAQLNLDKAKLNKLI